MHKIKSFYKPKKYPTCTTLFLPPTFHFFHFEFGIIYYINFTCTTLLLSKISPTLYHTFKMYHTFYIMFFNVPHILIPLLYYRCTTFSPVFCNLYHTLGANSKSVFLTYLFHKRYIYKITFWISYTFMDYLGNNMYS